MEMDTPMSDAAHRVFHTAELLENILLQVNDVATLLLSQRTCKLFEATIAGSIRLQRALFFKRDLGALEKQNPLLKYWSDPIVTSEGHLIDIEDDNDGKLGCKETIYFSFHHIVPTGPLSITGSWRRMHACHCVNGPSWVVLYRGWEFDFEGWIPADVQDRGVGDILDWALKKNQKLSDEEDAGRSPEDGIW